MKCFPTFKSDKAEEVSLYRWYEIQKRKLKQNELTIFQTEKLLKLTLDCYYLF